MAAGSDDADVMRFLLASDTHLGYLERDPVRGMDSFDAFREILELAKAQDVDFVLLGGDLFHENKPSRATMHKTMSLLREYTLGDKPISVELLSEPHDPRRKYGSFPSVNYEDANLNVSLPVFSIHGNHDDPQGSGVDGPLSALDVLSVAGLLNYFGRVELPSDTSSKRKVHDDALIPLRPLLLRKGTTRMALYGLGNIKDERLAYELESNHLVLYRPAEEPDAWFNLLTVHQNRAAHTPRGFLPESALDDSMDLIVWGHEHEQRILPEPVAEKHYYISQPGSSVATSLSPGETVEKCVAVVSVKGKDFKVDPIPLQSVRPFVMKDISLPAEAAAARLDTSRRTDVAQLLRQHVESLICAAQRAWDERVAWIPEEARRTQPLPLVRLRVAYDTQLPLGNLARFGHEFAGRIANPKDVIQLQLRRGRQPRAAPANHLVRLDKDMIPAEKLERVQLSSLVLENVRVQNFDLLDAVQLQQSVMGYVEKDEYVSRSHRRDAVEQFLQRTLPQIESELAAGQLDATQVQAELERVSARQRASLAALDQSAPWTAPQTIPPSQPQIRSPSRSPDSMDDMYEPPTEIAVPPTARRRTERRAAPRREGAARRASGTGAGTGAPPLPPSPSTPSAPLSARAAVLAQLGTLSAPRRRAWNDGGI